MSSTPPKSCRMQWLLALAGPASWPVVFVLALLMSRGVDGGWVGMHVMALGLAIILVIHLTAPLLLVAFAIHRRRAKMPAGKVAILGLCYYGLVAAVAVLLCGPDELFRDSSAALHQLFRAR